LRGESQEGVALAPGVTGVLFFNLFEGKNFLKRLLLIRLRSRNLLAVLKVVENHEMLLGMLANCSPFVVLSVVDYPACSLSS